MLGRKESGRGTRLDFNREKSSVSFVEKLQNYLRFLCGPAAYITVCF